MAVPPWLLLTFTFFLTITTTHSTPSDDVVLLLTKSKPSLQGPTQTASYPHGTPLFHSANGKASNGFFTNGTQLIYTPISSPNWSDISLSKNPALHLLSLQLPSANLSGNLPPELEDLSNLQSLYLSFNPIMGSIPLELGYTSSLQDIDFTYNFLNGSVPVSVWNLCDNNKLVSFRVHGNLLSGSIPKPGLPNASCANLTVLDFGRIFLLGLFLILLLGLPG
ncbi:putative non-specific serine/threonine protein kinase [Helianthus anomalus]